MAEPGLLDSSNPTLSDPFDPLHFPDDFPDDLSLPPGLMSDLGFDDFDIDFSIDDFLQLPEDQESPVADGSLDPDSKEGSSGVSSSSPVSGNQNFSDMSANMMNTPSPDSGNCSASGVADEEPNLEEGRKGFGLKRKKEKEDGSGNLNPNPRISKFLRSEETSSSCVFTVGSDEEDKRKVRMMRNRESAQLSRQRKKHYVEELEDKVKSMNSTIAELNSRISFFMAENVSLRQQLGAGAGGNCPPPPPVYPPQPPGMHFPWIPWSHYALRPQGSQIPLVPIPRLKPQRPASAPKVKKSQSKTKKVASVSILGLLLVILIIGGLFPGVNISYSGSSKSEFLGQSQGRVFSVSGHYKRLNETEGVGSPKVDHEWDTGKRRQIEMVGSEVKQKIRESQPLSWSESVDKQNSSEPLPALLYVPRNGKHVKINGNLIIHSVLASERAMGCTASRAQFDKEIHSSRKESKVTGLAIAERHSTLYRSSVKYQRALASDSEDELRDKLRSTPAEWFSEGLAGPILSSGMCTEVFQFNVLPDSANSSGITPAPSAANLTGKLPPTSAHSVKMRSRRILYPQPIPLNGSTVNNTGHFREQSKGSNFHGTNKSVSSMVVSVLADPRDAGEGDGDGMISPKSLTRIFVVVLLDSIKYVTYSCVLPLKGSGPHLVTT